MKGGTAPPHVACIRTSTSHNPILAPHDPIRIELQPLQRAWPLRSSRVHRMWVHMLRSAMCVSSSDA